MDIVTVIEAPKVAIRKIKKSTLPDGDSAIENHIKSILDCETLKYIKREYQMNVHSVQFHHAGENEYHLIIILK